MTAADQIERCYAGDLIPDWLGRTVTIQTLAGPFTGGLSDYRFLDDRVQIYVGGHELTVWPHAELTAPIDPKDTP